MHTVSYHNESIRTRAYHIWTRYYANDFRPLLNVEAFANLVQTATSEGLQSSLTSITGQKRSASAPDRVPKRSRLSSTSARDDEAGRFTWPRLDYPNLSRATSKRDEPQKDVENVPVFQHVLDIQYTTASPVERWEVEDESHSKKIGWDLEEDNLNEIFDGLRGSVTELDLGLVEFLEHHGRIVAVSDELRSQSGSEEWLLLVPSYTEGIDPEAYDFSSCGVEDLIKACYILKSVRRVALDVRLKLTVLPLCEDPHELPFRLQIEINGSLVIPTIFAPLPGKEPKKRVVEVEEAQRRLLHFVYPSGHAIPSTFDNVTNIPFFYSILWPAPPLLSKIAEDTMQPEALLPTLLPFQRRSVAWLLDREGKTVMSNGDIVPKAELGDLTFWNKLDQGNYTWYLSRLSGVLLPALPASHPVLGGILAEEPGLGKTLEMIALILLNPASPDRNPSMKRWDPESRLDVGAIKTTLIVTPPALVSQWDDELAAHAPSLRVLIYEGWSKVPVPITQSQAEEERLNVMKKDLKKRAKGKRRRKNSDDEDEEDKMNLDESVEAGEHVQDWCSYVNTFDVVITTYQVLRSDFNVALAAPVRPRREDVVYSNVERPRSPLVMCEWNRVIMDEVQMVGGGKTEDMVSLIPRLSSFAVSGTPARSQISDLVHVLKFLRVHDIADSARLWKRILRPAFAAQFAILFQKYAIRTTKATVKDELTIPQQTRFLVSIELGRVERHVYDQTLERALLDIGLDARGIAGSNGWQIDGTLLRSSLRKLRGICTHPQVGALQKAGDKLYKPGALKTMEDVLAAMKDQNWRNLMDDCKSKMQELIRFAQLQQRDEGDLNRYQHALETLLQAEKETEALLQELNTALTDHDANGEILKKEAAALRDSRMEVLGGSGQSSGTIDKGKGKERQPSEAAGEREDSEDGDLPRTPAGEEHAVKRRALRHRIRECRLILHRVKFLQGDAYHVLGASHSPSEDAAYSAAEEIRRDLLKITEDDAKDAMAQLALDATKKRITADALLIAVPFLDKGGIRSADLMVEANTIIEEVLNEQSALIWEWRTRVTGLLMQKLSPGEGEADGQEYQRTLDDQGEAETYLQVYTALLADRREALMNERTLLAAHDVREKKLRHTKAAIKAATAAMDHKLVQLVIPEDIELQPEHEVLHKELSLQRKELLQLLQGRAIKSILVDLNAVITRIAKDTDLEKVLVKQAIAKLRQLISDQGTLMDKLDADLTLIRKAFNQRILYFRQLQEISDSVSEVTWESTLADARHACITTRTELEAKINMSRARQRYLQHLAQNKDDGIVDEDEETCILCRCEFTRGFITQCAHIFCEGCMKAWITRKEGKTCPVCRVPIDPDTIQRFTMNEPEAAPPPQPINSEPAPKSRRQIAYNRIDPASFNEIQTVESYGDYGSKIQALVRHLLYLRLTDPGAKSIVFSAWADSLHIVEWALIENGIQCLRVDQKSRGESAAKRFRTDPDILVLLLHGERENAGLNVTCASRVFLLESVVHHGFEIQAIARIDRMGQTRPTEVYCYYAEDTVERNILDLAARQGLSLYTKENSAGTVNVSFALDSEQKVDSPVKKVQKGDFIFKIDDMLAILFPHMYEEIEYLVPPEETPNVDVTSTNLYNMDREPVYNGQNMNAVAGPSRLN